MSPEWGHGHGRGGVLAVRVKRQEKMQPPCCGGACVWENTRTGLEEPWI